MLLAQVNPVGMLRWLWVSLVVIVLDQITKSIAVDHLQLYQSMTILNGFNFTLMHNVGAAFSFLSDASGWQRWLFTAISVVVSTAIVVWIKYLAPDQRLIAVALALILGGAIGNLCDRVMLGYVIDFIDIYYGDHHWPAFNIADSAISVGAALLILEWVVTARQQHNTASTQPNEK